MGVLIKMNVWSKEELKNCADWFVDVHRFELIAGNVFTSGNNWISKLISKCTKKGNDDFTPSHVGQIIMVNSVLYVFDMKPPRPKLTELKEWLKTQKDDYRLIFRPYEFDALKYSTNVMKRANKKYPYWSAIQCKLKINYELPTPKNEDDAIAKKAEHCSEITMVEYQKFGYFKEINANKATPEDVFELFRGIEE